MVFRIRIVIGKHARIVVCPDNDLWRHLTSFCNDVLDWMPQRFRFLNFHLPARRDELITHPFPDFSMSLGPRYARPECDLRLHVRVGALSIEGNGLSFRLGRTRI